MLKTDEKGGVGGGGGGSVVNACELRNDYTSQNLFFFCFSSMAKQSLLLSNQWRFYISDHPSINQ